MKRWMLRTASAVLAAAVVFLTPARAVDAPEVSARSALVLDCCTGRVLYEKNADARSLIASTTKIMTALVVLENDSLDARVRIRPEAVGVEGSSLYLKAGEVLTVRELLLGLMLQSGNDAAMALAIYCGGTCEAFVERMNEKAAQLGLADTHFANPHGLDDAENYSTARDLATLSMHALENETFRALVSTRSATVAGRALTNHNKLLWRVSGAIGVKTGYTRAAGRILVGAAERDGRRLVCVTIGAPDDWNDQAKLFDHAFSAYETRVVAARGEVLAEVPVASGDRACIRAAAGETFSCSLREDETVQTVLHLPRMVFAPIWRGETAGYAVFYLNGQQIGQTPLYWAESVFDAPEAHRSFWQRIIGK